MTLIIYNNKLIKLMEDDKFLSFVLFNAVYILLFKKLLNFLIDKNFVLFKILKKQMYINVK